MDHTQHDIASQEGASDFVSAPNTVRTDKDFIVKDFFVINNTDAKFLRGQIIARKAITVTYSAATLDYLIGVTSLVTAPTIGLPRPKNVGVGKTYRIKDEAGGAASTTITIVSQGEETIDGASSSTLTTNYQAKSFYTDGTNWFTF